MTDSLKGMKRTDYCANFNTENIGQEITVFGWVQRQRDLGNLIFIDLRDRTGIIQLSFNDKTDREIFSLAQSVRSEYVAPPHGGMGIGLDRLAMLICGADSLRDVVAFPKVQNASELMSGAPSYIDDVQLDELGIDLKASDKNE